MWIGGHSDRFLMRVLHVGDFIKCMVVANHFDCFSSVVCSSFGRCRSEVCSANACICTHAIIHVLRLDFNQTESPVTVF